MMNAKTEKKICSGDEFFLETNDPDRLSLPDWRLLGDAVDSDRVRAMSEAAELHYDFYKDDGDVLVGNEEDLEVEDE